MRVYIGKQIANLRKVTGTPPKRLAWVMDTDEDTIRQWEAGRRSPTLATLQRLADYFHVSVDFLLTGEPDENAQAAGESEAAGQGDKQPVTSQELPDDGRLRVVQFLGSRIVARDDFDPDRPIPLCVEPLQRAHDTGEKLQIEIWGSAQIEGNISGSITAGGNICCGNIAGGVRSGKDVDCGNITGDVVVNGSLDCGKIVGPVICKNKVSEE